MPSAPASTALIAAWARSAVAPHGGAFRRLHAHEIAAPVLCALLQRAHLCAADVDAVIIGNALGAGGNPARLLALAAGLPQRCAALSVDSQCCAGLDAVSVAVGLLASGQARLVVAGGVEAWSRAPLRSTRPMRPDEAAVPYERPAFAPDPARDPDLLDCAAEFAEREGITGKQQDHYAWHSHQRALQHRQVLASEIVPILGLQHDAYVRNLAPERLPRLPRLQLAVKGRVNQACAMSTLAVSAKADGAALLLLASEAFCRQRGLRPQAAWLASASTGRDPAMPLLAAEAAARAAMQTAGIGSASDLQAVELHDAFAVQGLVFCRNLGLAPLALNRKGGGLARGHPIGASGAVALVRLLADLAHDQAPGARGLAAVAGAGGVGAAVVVRRL